MRRAAAGVTSTVSSTVSTVASVASGKKRHDSAGGTRHSFYEANLISNAKEKYTMTVKVRLPSTYNQRYLIRTVLVYPKQRCLNDS